MVGSSSSLYVWGNGILKPKLFSLGCKIIQIACGAANILALGANGDIYSWGEGSSGQLGLGDLTKTSHPTIIESLKGELITFISASHAQSAAIGF